MLNNTSPMGKKNKPFDVFGFLQRYGVLCLGLGSLLFMLPAPLVWVFSSKEYEAAGLLRIEPVVPSLITKSEDPSIINYFGDFARTQVQRLRQPGVIADAVARMDPAQQKELFGDITDPDLQQTLLNRRLSVRHLGRTHLLEIRARGWEAQQPAWVINHLMDAYIAACNQEMEDKQVRRLNYLDQKRIDLLRTIRGMESKLKDTAESILTASFSENYNLNHHRVQWLQKAHVAQYADMVREQHTLASQEVRQEATEQLTMEPMVSELVMKDQSIDFTSSWTYQELQKMRASLDGVSSDNTDRMYVERRMEAMREYEAKLLSETEAVASKVLYGKRAYDLETTIINAQSRYNAASAAEDDLAAELDRAKAASAAFSRKIIGAESLKAQLGYTRDLLFRIDTRIQELRAEAQAPPRVSIETRATAPRFPAPSNKKKLILMLFVAAFGVSGALFLALELMDTRIRKAANLSDALGQTASIEVPKDREHIQQAADTLAVQLLNEQQNNPITTLVFSGVHHRVGVTTMTHHTAAALARFGKRVLLLDTTENAVGVPKRFEEMRSLLNNAINHKGTRQEDATYDRLPLGDWIKHPRLNRRLAELLNHLNKAYDLICIDTDPISTTPISQYLAGQGDVALLLAQGHQTHYRALRETAQTLIRLGVPVIAPVLNWGAPIRWNLLERVMRRLPQRLIHPPIPFAHLFQST